MLNFETKIVSKNDPIFNDLFNQNVYSMNGIFGMIWYHSKDLISEKAYLSIARNSNKIIGVSFVSPKDWYNWDEFFDSIEPDNGLMGVYVKPNFRNKGIATSLTKELVSLYGRKPYIVRQAIPAFRWCANKEIANHL